VDRCERSRPKTELSITQNSANAPNPTAHATGSIAATRVRARYVHGPNTNVF